MLFIQYFFLESLFDMLGKDLKKKLEKEDGPSH